MTFRSRVALAFGLGAMLPLALLAFGVRREMTRRLTRQADDRVELQVGVVRESVADQVRGTGDRLDRLAQSLSADNRFRLALASGSDAELSWLRDWAGGAMRQSEFAMLELQDSAERVLSSGHFRNEFGRVHRGLSAAITGRPGNGAIVRARTPEGEVDVLGASRSFTVAGRPFHLVGGRGLDLAGLIPRSDPEIRAELVTGLSPAAGQGRQALEELPMPFITSGDSVVSGEASIVLTRNLEPMLQLRRSVDRWFLTASMLLLLLTIGLALWLASRVTQPIAELAEKTSRVDLDRLDQEFSSGRTDEIGALAKLLDAMTTRLRASAGRLREAERRATTGDLARQINHDVKNGLAPIRHVLRHLSQVASEHPEQLALIYRERQATLDSSVEYLENLSRNYARLSPALDRATTDPNAVLGEVARSLGGWAELVEVKLGGQVPAVRSDAVALRRILENLAGNAVDAVKESNGRVVLSSEALLQNGVPWVRLSIADTGRGMSREELDKAFDDFYTTKDGGTGLGLSVVRRLVTDLGGTLRVETAPGQGSRFIVELPAA